MEILLVLSEEEPKRNGAVQNHCNKATMCRIGNHLNVNSREK
jgi:hypothetical protein